MSIPAFGQDGVLPPFLAHATDPSARSPYRTSAEELVGRFGTSTERRSILRGLLDYRDALRTQLSLADAVQWLDGSFVEDIETFEARPPGDVDLLTIAKFPPLSVLSAPQRALLSSQATKTQFRCDAYPLDLGRARSPSHLLQQVTYWFGLFSHRRDGRWKGLVEIGLDAADDARARARLDALS